MSEENAPLAAIDIEIGSYDDVEAEANRKLAPGKYKAQILTVPEVKYAQTSGNPYLAWRLQTVDCADPDDNNFTLFYNTPMGGKGRGIFLRFMSACGARWEGTRITNEFLESLVGTEVIVEVGMRVYNGQESNDVKKVESASSVPF